MDARRCMIVDLKQRGDKRMFITERVASITRKSNGLWTVRFSSSPKPFQYNQARLLYLTQPEEINLEERGLYIDNRHITDVIEVLRFSDDRNTFYRITHPNGFAESIEGRNVYITRTPIDKLKGLYMGLSAETGRRNRSASRR